VKSSLASLILKTVLFMLLLSMNGHDKNSGLSKYNFYYKLLVSKIMSPPVAAWLGCPVLPALYGP
jgi:hypothetical protein